MELNLTYMQPDIAEVLNLPLKPGVLTIICDTRTKNLSNKKVAVTIMEFYLMHQFVNPHGFLLASE